MERAITQFTQIHAEQDDDDDIDDAMSQLWPDAAIQMLLFTLAKDPSVKIRRAAMALLTAVPSHPHSPQMEAVVQLLVLKCSDRDSAVQTQAYSMLAQLPGNVLTEHLSIEDWRTVLDIALLSNLSSGISIVAQQELQSFGDALLHKWIRLEQLHAVCSKQGLHIMNDENTTQAIQQAAAYIQALHIPWHNPAMYQAYSDALCLSLL